jgi:serine/threonine protein kinase
MVKATKFLHDNNYCHLDIRPDNFLINSEFTASLANFGSLGSEGVLTKFHGIRGFRAPEIELLKEGGEAYQGKPADIFSLGVSLFQLFFNYHPFKSATEG